MATANAINANDPGLVKYDNTTGVFSATTVTDHAILVGAPSNAISSKILTDGQILIGSTGADPVAASITAGTGITVTPGAGSISISANPVAGTNIQKASITLTNAQIKALNVTPVNLLPAPGVGSAHYPLYSFAKLNYGGNDPFTGSGSIQFKCNPSSTTVGSPITAARLALSENAYTSSFFPETSIVSSLSFQNNGIDLSATSAITGNAANDNTVTIDLYYVTVSI